MATIELTDTTIVEKIESSDILLVDCWAQWCGPCRAFEPIFEQASEQYPDIVFGKIDMDANQEFGSAAQVSAIPTLMIFREGINVYRNAGAIAKKQLTELITQVQALDMDDVRKQLAEQES